MLRSVLFACLLPVAAVAEERPGTLAGLDHPFFQPFLTAQAFDCRQTTCTQIGSCEEACYKLTVCGHTRRDGDNDGIPCENLCSRRCDRR